MRTLLRFLLAGTLVLTGCTPVPWTRVPWARPPAAIPGAPVALVLEGSACTRAAVRDRIEAAVERLSGHPVRLVAPAEAGADHRRALAAKVVKENPDLADYEWREPQCAAEAAVLVALATNTDAVYRVALDGTTRTRPITTADLQSPAARAPAMWKFRLALGGEQPQTVREESLTGAVALSSFSRTPGAPPLRIERQTLRIGPGGPARLFDPAAVATDALRDLPPPRVPEWEPYARRLVSAGCPLLAMSVANARLGAGSTFRSLHSAAVDAMRRNVNRRAARALRDTVAPVPAEAPAPAAVAAAEAPTCQALCSMHMVELCNNDVQLWIEHRVRWEATPCGTRRQDEFLEECYRQQWQSGTFDGACVTPCQTTPEGRERLESILRRAGCLRDRTS